MKMRPQMRKDVFRAAGFKNFKDARFTLSSFHAMKLRANVREERM